jgi:hypothetical protein
LARAEVEEHIVWLGIAVEIRHTRQVPARRKSRPVSAADKNVVVHVPDRRLARVKVEEHIVWLGIAVEIRHILKGPGRRKSRAISAADKNVIVHVPNRSLVLRLHPSVEQHIVWLGIAVEIRHTLQEPGRRKSRPVSAADKNVIVHVPNRRLARAPVVQYIVRLGIAVEIVRRPHLPNGAERRSAEILRGLNGFCSFAGLRYGHARSKQSEGQCRAGEENQTKSSGQIKSGLCKVHFHFWPVLNLLVFC